MTFSIVARSEDGSTWGVAVASKFLAVGNAVPAAVAGIGALATQADANVSWKGHGLSLLDEGASATAALQQLLAEDDKPEQRQIGIVDGLIPCARCEIGNGASDLDPRVKSHRMLRAAMLLSGSSGTEGFRELAEREVVAIPRELSEIQSL